MWRSDLSFWRYRVGCWNGKRMAEQRAVYRAIVKHMNDSPIRPHTVIKTEGTAMMSCNPGFWGPHLGLSCAIRPWEVQGLFVKIF